MTPKEVRRLPRHTRWEYKPFHDGTPVYRYRCNGWPVMVVYDAGRWVLHYQTCHKEITALQALVILLNHPKVVVDKITENREAWE